MSYWMQQGISILGVCLFAVKDINSGGRLGGGIVSHMDLVDV